MPRCDPHDLKRFLVAQQYRGTYRQALAELTAGTKRTHWIWFVMPTLPWPGSSAVSAYYALGGRRAARAYLRHPVLGPRLLACVRAVLAVRGRTLLEIFGPLDEPKVRSCAALFASLGVDTVFFRLLYKP